METAGISSGLRISTRQRNSVGKKLAGVSKPRAATPKSTAAPRATPKAPLRPRRMQAVQANAAAVATIAAATTAFVFTPFESLLGGLTLGVLASSKLALTGRILGISGIVRGVVRGGVQAWRVAFVTGLVAGGFVLQLLLPSAFEVLPAAYSLQRAVAAGLLVGMGTSMGSGCTSGHGICGNSRLSVRSMVATLSFMASGAVAAHLAGSAALFGLPTGIAPLLAGGAVTPAALFGVGVLVLTVVAMAALGAAARGITRIPSQGMLAKELEGAEVLEESPLTGEPPAEPADAQKLASLVVFTELAVGFLFALGLGVSGMVKPSKVAAFLSVIGGVFDPSLMLVMGGALLVSLPAFQTMLRIKPLQRPVCALSFDLPSKSQVDAPLVVGALLFGAGWGIGGVCPGPGIVAIASLQPQILALIASMLVGMWLEGALQLSAALQPKVAS